LAPKFRTKNARVNVDEIDTWHIPMKRIELRHEVENSE
jgi:hypothetical protein